MTTLREILSLLNATLEPERYNDYCPNGLQVEGRPEVRKIVTGVTASAALIDAAIAAGADALLVHHGYFWKGEDPCITGMKKARIAKLLAHDISLIAYHLPLDGHPVLGNNAQLALQLGISIDGLLQPDKPRSVGNTGHFHHELAPEALAELITAKLGRVPQHIPGRAKTIKRIGFCTGGAQSYIEHAVALGLDAYISGEISEPTVHAARECGIHYFAAGHHATERYGAPALGEFLKQQLGVEHQFIDIENPV